MKRIAFALAALLLSTGVVRAQSANVQGADIVDYGIYTVDVTKSERDANGVLHNDFSNLRHAITTQNVQAQFGVTFGIEYRINGIPAGAQVPIRIVTVFPQGGLHPTGKSPVPQDISDRQVIVGQTNTTWWMFQDPWELVPGTWTFQIWSGDRKLVEQSFTVVAR